MNKRLLWTCFLLSCVGHFGCTTTRQVRRQDRPPARRPVPPRPVLVKRDPRALGKVTSGRYAMARLGKVLGGKRRGSLAPTQVKPLIERAKPAMHVCMTKFQRRFPGSADTFKVRLWIGPQGRVWKSRFAGDLNADPRTLRCLRGVLHRLHFLAPGGFFVWTQDVRWHASKPAKRPSKRK